MSRVEENREMLEKVPKGFNGAYDRVNNAVLIAQLYVLKDISKSLAVIADAKTTTPMYGSDLSYEQLYGKRRDM